MLAVAVALAMIFGAALLTSGRKQSMLTAGMHTNSTQQASQYGVCLIAGGVGRKVQHA